MDAESRVGAQWNDRDDGDDDEGCGGWLAIGAVRKNLGWWRSAATVAVAILVPPRLWLRSRPDSRFFYLFLSRFFTSPCREGYGKNKKKYSRQSIVDEYKSTGGTTDSKDTPIAVSKQDRWLQQKKRQHEEWWS